VLFRSYQIFNVTSTTFISGSPGYYILGITSVASNGTINVSDRVGISFTKNGSIGAEGAGGATGAQGATGYFSGTVSTDILPSLDSSYNIGGTGYYFNALFANSIYTSSSSIYVGATATISASSTGNLVLPTVQYNDSTTQITAYRERELNDCEILSLESGKNILCSTFNLGNVVASYVGSSQNVFFYAVKLVKNQTYKGIGLIIGTSGSITVGLYNKGLSPTLLASSVQTSLAGTGMTFIDFQTPYTPTTTDIYYAAYVPVGNINMLYAPNNPYSNHTYGTTNGTLNLRSQFCTLTSLPATISASQAMSSQDLIGYVVLYGV
jgi:hypothetical protein